jgi:predicted metalloprotease with PDZ domain
MIRFLQILVLSLVFKTALSQTEYRYAVNLNNLQDDNLKVELITPAVTEKTIVFSMPKIIPGTYSISDFGKFVKELKAFNKAGKELPVVHPNENQWQISKANQLHRITYVVEDIYDTEIKHGIFPMAATNIEEGKNIVLNTPGVFGFLEGMQNRTFEISFEKPAGFYGATSLEPKQTSATKDIFSVANVTDLYEHPIMYNKPDTTTLRIGNTDVLISSYSPNNKITSKDIAGWLKELLHAAHNYLGGKLPADRYAFLYYFKDPAAKHSFPAGQGGALEHPTSSFYYFTETKPEAVKNSLVDVSSHEFFHIITPLTIASKEVKNFNFSEPVLSKHLWLYEGVTEYTAHHVQVKQGLNTMKQFLDKMSQKINFSRAAYNDTLAFTELSKESAGKWAKQYGNVYQKGALIAMCLDIYLLHLSNGNYGLKNLTHDLAIRYAKQPFDDDQLFETIVDLTYPEVKQFFLDYVAGSKPIPYADFLQLAGVQLNPEVKTSVLSLGGFNLVPNAKGVVTIASPYKANDFGTKMGYKAGDEVYAFNGKRVTVGNYPEVVNEVKQAMKEGETLTATVGRKNANNKIDTIELSATIFKATTIQKNQLVPSGTATGKQRKVQIAWLNSDVTDMADVGPADPKDVSSIDAIIKASYEVISGPAGPRNWQRHHSLFSPDAKLGATSGAEGVFNSFSPAEYKKMNSPLFMQTGFFEDELGRTASQYGNIAQVQSAYQYRFTPDGPVAQRGVNYFTLVKSNGRWWIRSIVWQPETKDNPIPATLLAKK